MSNKYSFAILLFALVLLCVVFVAMRCNRPDDPPVIEISQDELVYEYGTPEKVLLQGVTASDIQDGDLSSDVCIDRIAYSEDKTQAVVRYYVYDSDENLATAQRKITVKNYTEPTDDEELERTQNQYAIEKTVARGTAPAIELSTDYVRLHTGEKFDPFLYVKKVAADSNNAKIMYHSVPAYISSSKEATYTVQYYVRTESGLWSDIKNLTLVYADADSAE